MVFSIVFSILDLVLSFLIILRIHNLVAVLIPVDALPSRMHLIAGISIKESLFIGIFLEEVLKGLPVKLLSSLKS